MKRRLVASIVAIGAFALGGFAYAGHVQEVDPSTVPAGFLVTHNHINWIGLRAIDRAVKPDGADISVQHIRLAAHEATSWHTHPGPVFVSFAAGSGTLEKVKNGTCFRKLFEAGTGFFDRGQVHRVVAGFQGAEIYATFVLPKGSPGHIALQEAGPSQCA